MSVVHIIFIKNTLIALQLETDESILIPKARGALEKYGHELVIGNVLQTRKVHVVLVEARSTENIDLTQASSFLLV